MSQKGSNYVRLLKLLCSRVECSIYDIDDATYTIAGRNRETINFFANKCKLITVGSQALSENLKGFSRKIAIITTPVYHSEKVKDKKSELFNIGWLGYYDVHRENIRYIVAPVLLKLDFNFKFTILGVQRDTEEQEIIELFKSTSCTMDLDIPRDVNWGDENEIVERICKFDVGLSPMLPNEYNECKSAFKLKQYHSCGVPVLASPIGENTGLIEEGVIGVLCDTEDEWFKGILFYKNLSEEAFLDVVRCCRDSYLKSDYSLNKAAGALINAISGINQNVCI